MQTIATGCMRFPPQEQSPTCCFACIRITKRGALLRRTGSPRAGQIARGDIPSGASYDRRRLPPARPRIRMRALTAAFDYSRWKILPRTGRRS
jgi:hypothetical protein